MEKSLLDIMYTSFYNAFNIQGSCIVEISDLASSDADQLSDYLNSMGYEVKKGALVSPKPNVETKYCLHIKKPK